FASSDFRAMFHQSGALSEYSALNWALISQGAEDLPKQPSVAQIVRAADGFPMIESDKRAVGKEIPFFRDWVRHEQPDDYWSQIDSVERIDKVHCPTMLTAAWFDPFLPTSLQDYQTLRSSSNKEVATNSRLVIGPWGHGHDVCLP